MQCNKAHSLNGAGVCWWNLWNWNCNLFCLFNALRSVLWHSFRLMSDMNLQTRDGSNCLSLHHYTRTMPHSLEFAYPGFIQYILLFKQVRSIMIARKTRVICNFYPDPNSLMSIYRKPSNGLVQFHNGTLRKRTYSVRLI